MDYKKTASGVDPESGLTEVDVSSYKDSRNLYEKIFSLHIDRSFDNIRHYRDCCNFNFAEFDGRI